MAVLRKEKKGDFTVIDNAIFRNQGLSLKAKGMLCLLLSLPDYWEFSVAGLVKLSTDGKSAVTSALNELEDAGYFRREQARNNGNFGGAVYVISEVPFSEKPMTENPTSEKPMTGNLPQLNTNISNTNKSKTKDIYMGLPENLKETLYEFEEMRKSIKKPMTDAARKRLITELQKLAGEDVQLMIKILDQSILNSWAGVYPLKTNSKNGNKQKDGFSAFADMLGGKSPFDFI